MVLIKTEIIDREVNFTLDDHISTLMMVSFYPLKYNSSNVINCKITYTKEDIEEWNIFYTGEYTSTFEYNRHNYLTKETRWHKGANEPEIIQFFYITTGTRTR